MLCAIGKIDTNYEKVTAYVETTFHLRHSVSDWTSVSLVEEPLIYFFFNIPRNPYLWKRLHTRKKACFSTSNWRTKIYRFISRGVWNCSRYLNIITCLIHDFWPNPQRWSAEPWLGNTGLNNSSNFYEIGVGVPYFRCSSVQELSMQCRLAVVIVMKIGVVKAVHYLVL